MSGGLTNSIARWTSSSNLGTASIFDGTSTVDFYKWSRFNSAVTHKPIQNSSVSGTYSLNMTAANMWIITLTASTTLTTTNEQFGSYIVIVSQNATGNYALNLVANKFIGATSISIGTASNAKSIIQMVYDGSRSIITSQRNLINL